MRGISEPKLSLLPNGGLTVLTYTTVGLVFGRSPPRSVLVKIFARLAVSPGRVVLTVARLFPVLLPPDAPGRVAVTLAASADREVGERVVVAVLGSIVRAPAVVPEGVQLVEDELDIRGCHPVLERGALVKTGGDRQRVWV